MSSEDEKQGFGEGFATYDDEAEIRHAREEIGRTYRGAGALAQAGVRGAEEVCRRLAQVDIALNALEEALEPCYHLADSDEPEGMEPKPCPRCGRYYVDD